MRNVRTSNYTVWTVARDGTRHCTTTMALWRFLLERLMTAQAFKNVNIYILFLKTRYLKLAATRHQLQGSTVYTLA